MVKKLFKGMKQNFVELCYVCRGPERTYHAIEWKSRYFRELTLAKGTKSKKIRGNLQVNYLFVWINDKIWKKRLYGQNKKKMKAVWGKLLSPTS